MFEAQRLEKGIGLSIPGLTQRPCCGSDLLLEGERAGGALLKLRERERVGVGVHACACVCLCVRGGNSYLCWILAKEAVI